MDNKFYIKAALIGALGTSISSYRYNDLGNVSINVPIWITVMVFMEHFLFILLFWLAFENKLRVKNWVLAGFLGSLLYAVSFWTIRGFIYPESSVIYFIDKPFIGVLGAIPLWLVLRRHYSKAYLWILGNAIGYAFIGVFPIILGFVLSMGAVKNIANHSFLMLQLIPNSLWIIAYSLFGLVLGVCLDKILNDGTEGVMASADRFA